MPIIEAIALYIADKILEQIIQEEVWFKRIWLKIFPPETFKNQLVKIIYKTIEEFEKINPYDSSSGLFPFYHSQVFFEHISNFVLFEKGSLEDIKEDFSQNPRIIKPTQDELNSFYDLFFENVKSDPKLERLFINENYKKQIFDMSSVIDEIKNVVDLIKVDTAVTKVLVLELTKEKEDKNLTTQKTIEALNSQVNRQINKQVNSGKYLKDTFIEIGNQKDHLRYLCDPVFYSEKCFEEIIILDFRYLNNFLKSKNHSEFDLDFEKFNITRKGLNVANSYRIINEWFIHLENKKQELVDMKIASYHMTKFESKINNRIEDLIFLKSKITIITEMAGQGKTNFLCDFAENFLLKRGIPCLFITGAEVNADDLRLSILRRVFPDSTDYTFEDLLNNLKIICYEQNKFIVLIIDGINENYKPKLLSQNLELFIAELLEYDFVRIVLSCRTEYYQQNFLNLQYSSFSKELQMITSLMNNRSDDIINEKLFGMYFEHFNIKYRNISDKAYKQLVSNFLLLRIFCEAYQNQSLNYIENIYKEELFELYYSVKSEEINKRLRDNDEFKITGAFDIKNFISNLVEYMIQTKNYVNVPLDQIIKFPKDREMYVRFLDENILIKRDLQTDSKGIFTSSEVVNFTFDEFRDFIISRFLIENLYKKSKAEFTLFIESEISEKSPLLEGCSTFLFFVSRKDTDQELNGIISIQPWFESVFSECLFSLKDSQVTDDDKRRLIENFKKDTGTVCKSIIFNLILRNNVEHYQKLNIDFLFNLLRELDEEHYERCFVSKFGNTHYEYSQINQKSLLDYISNIFENKEIKEHSSYHKFFELLIYMFTNKNGWEIQSLYEKYMFQHIKIAKEQLRKSLKSKNGKLIKELNQFLSIYEIRL